MWCVERWNVKREWRKKTRWLEKHVVMGQMIGGNQRGQLDKDQYMEMEEMRGGTRKEQEKRLEFAFKDLNNDERINEMSKEKK